MRRWLRLPQSIHPRVVLSHLLVSLISIVLVAAFAATAIFNAAYRDMENSLEDLALSASNALSTPVRLVVEGKENPESLKTPLAQVFSRFPDINYAIYGKDGNPIISNREITVAKADSGNAPEVWQAFQSDVGEGSSVRLNRLGERAYFVAVTVRSDEKVIGVLRVSIPIQTALAPARRWLALLLFVSLMVAGTVSLFGWFLANTLTQPIQDLTEAASRLARGDLNARVVPTGPQEIHRLSEAFNFMAGRLQDHVVELRAFVANASHELRTPLTVVKLRAEALQDGALEDPPVAQKFLDDIENEVDRLGVMVNDLLDLSRLEAGLTPEKQTQINLTAVATDVFETLSIRAARAGLELKLDIEPDLPNMIGNEDQIRRVFYNFVDNAIKYTTKGGQVEVYLRAGKNRKAVRILVKDTGVGISAEDLTHIFERFFRVEATRPRSGTGADKGSGLGLAIAKSIVEGHGGRIGVTSQLGKGSTFWAELPTNT